MQGFSKIFWFETIRIISLNLPTLKEIYDPLKQTCTTYGPRAKCGLRKLSILPAKPKFLFVLLAFFMKTSFVYLKILIFGPRTLKTIFFGAPRDLSCAPLL